MTLAWSREGARPRLGGHRLDPIGRASYPREMRVGVIRVLALLGGPVCAVACGIADFTYANPTSEGGSSHASGASADGSPAVWSGPGTFFDETAERLDCPAGYVTDLVGHVGEAEPLSCGECTCAPPDTSVCEDATFAIGCNDSPSFELKSQGNDACAQTSANQVTRIDCKPVECVPRRSDGAPIVRWRGVQRFCRLQQSGSVPPADSSLDHGECIWKAGEHPCPPGSPYQTNLKTFAEVDDRRTCSECQCSPGICGAVTVSGYDNANCSGAFRGNLVLACDQCRGGLGGHVGGIKWMGAEPASGCTPTVSTPIGEVHYKSPTTVCCSH